MLALPWPLLGHTRRFPDSGIMAGPYLPPSRQQASHCFTQRKRGAAGLSHVPTHLFPGPNAAEQQGKTRRFLGPFAIEFCPISLPEECTATEAWTLYDPVWGRALGPLRGEGTVAVDPCRFGHLLPSPLCPHLRPASELEPAEEAGWACGKGQSVGSNKAR